MPVTHHSSASPPAPPSQDAEASPSASPSPSPPADPAARTPPSAAAPPPDGATVVGRIPVLDVRPVVQHGRRPAKAVTGETFEVSATVFREGHDAVAANVVLRDPQGRPGPWTPMRELAPGTDRWGAEVTPDAPGHWTYRVEAWSDPVSTWRHHARIKIPAGMDTNLVLEEGARLYERAAAGVPVSPDGSDSPEAPGSADVHGRSDVRERSDVPGSADVRGSSDVPGHADVRESPDTPDRPDARGSADRRELLAAVDALRDRSRPAASRLAAALTPQVDAVLARHPLRDLVTTSDPLPLLVERERALYGAWYEFFPRSEGTPAHPH
ncbi:maltotransferase domain-containing protein, partial [Streptomyces olivaceus]|uniref:maltotransferase domain-containing protein n=1 Tax=Streptomyces olivaceus TaxID=47716 RepID=UPI00331DE91A